MSYSPSAMARSLPVLPRAACKEISDPDPLAGRKAVSPGTQAMQRHQQYQEQIEDIRQFCSYCPEVIACREFGIVHNEMGYWGGLSQQERGQLAKSRQRTLRERTQEVNS
jgi:Transcription factor WhiB